MVGNVYGTISGTVATVGTVSGTVLSTNASRKGALFINDSDTAIYLSFGTAAAVASSGVRVNASGGVYEMTQTWGNLWRGPVTAISTAASKKLLITEGT